MVVETLVDEETVSEVDDAAEEAAFESGFNGTDLEPAPEEAQTAEPEPAQEQEPEPAQEQEPEAEEAPTGEAKALSVDDLKAMMEAQQQEYQRKLDTVFGKIGNLQQKIDSAKSVSNGLSAKARERLQADFPELAGMLFDDDGEPEPVANQGGYEPPAALPPLPDLPGIEEVELNFSRKLLSRDHRDWEQVVASQDFSNWQNSVLTPEQAAEMNSSRDPDVVSDGITKFKAWQKAQSDKAEEDKRKKERLAGAVTPKGIPRDSAASYSDDDEESAMLSAFRTKITTDFLAG